MTDKNEAYMEKFDCLNFRLIKEVFESIMGIPVNLDEERFWARVAKVPRPRDNIIERNAIRAQVLAEYMLDKRLIEDNVDFNTLTIKDIIDYNSK